MLSCASNCLPWLLRTSVRGAARTLGHSSRALTTVAKPWAVKMPDAQLARLKAIVEAPSPVGLEGAMSHGVCKPLFEEVAAPSWGVRSFQGSASVVLDTHPGAAPGEKFTLMLVGHADKIRMQVRSIGSDGKIWINSDSFLPLTLLGNEVTLFSEDPARPGESAYRRVEGGTVEALGAIHFASANVRSGAAGIKADQLYLELGLHGDDRKSQVEALGIRPGDSLLLKRPLVRGFGVDTVYGPYLDNGAGCFVVAEVARLAAEAGLLGTDSDVRVQFAIASHEEIGRFGSRVLASELVPDALIAIDVNHDYDAAPGVGDRRFPSLKMGGGFTLSVGAIASEALNGALEKAAGARGIPSQRDVVGRDTGTDAMAAVLGNIDCAATSVGFPIRNMHTVSELAHTGDLLAATHAVFGLIEDMATGGAGQLASTTDFCAAHARLDLDTQVLTGADALALASAMKKKKKKKKEEEEGEEGEEKEKEEETAAAATAK